MMMTPKGYCSSGSHTGSSSSSSEEEEEEEVVNNNNNNIISNNFYYDLSRHGEVLMLVNPLMEDDITRGAKGGDAPLRKQLQPPSTTAPPSKTALESHYPITKAAESTAQYCPALVPGTTTHYFEMMMMANKRTGSGKRKNSCPVKQNLEMVDSKRIKLEAEEEEFDRSIHNINNINNINSEEPVDLRLDFARHVAFERETSLSSSSPTSSSSSSPAAVILSVPRFEAAPPPLPPLAPMGLEFKNSIWGSLTSALRVQDFPSRCTHCPSSEVVYQTAASYEIHCLYSHPFQCPICPRYCYKFLISHWLNEKITYLLWILHILYILPILHMKL